MFFCKESLKTATEKAPKRQNKFISYSKSVFFPKNKNLIFDEPFILKNAEKQFSLFIFLYI